MTEKSTGAVALNFSYLSILFLNVMNFVSPIPIAVQLFFCSLSCIYIGSRRGIIIQEKLEKEEKEKSPGMSVREAYLFPIYGSVVLLGLYVVYKIFDKNLLNAVLSFHFTIFGFLSLVQLLCYHIERFVPEWGKLYVLKKKFELNLKIYSRTFDISINRSEVIAGLITIPPTVLYFLTKNWLLNNLFGVAFSICGIESLVLPNFQIGFILLWGLFFYDIFWVYGTDVMVTVAKSVEAPIKLLFPVNLAAEQPAFSMLGLGDIVIPGVLIALCLKYDVDKAILNFRRQGIKEFNYDLISTPLFNWCMGGYALGIALTFWVMIVFNHPQPALLFLVPCCCLAVILYSLKNRELKQVFDYNEDQIRDYIGYTSVAKNELSNKEK